jgi:hypothetical protein
MASLFYDNETIIDEGWQRCHNWNCASHWRRCKSPRQRQGNLEEKGRVVEEDLREQREEMKERKGEVVAKLRKINEMENEEDLKLKRLVQLRKI